MTTLFPFPSSKAPVRAMSSTNWAEVLGGRGLASMVSKLETTAYPALLFPSKTKLLPSVYQISSGLVRGSSDNPSRGFVQWSKVSFCDLYYLDFSTSMSIFYTYRLLFISNFSAFSFFSQHSPFKNVSYLSVLCFYSNLIFKVSA